MNWKIILQHGCLLLLAGIAAGVLEPQSDAQDAGGMLVSYLLTEAAFFLVCAGIYAHLAYRASSRPFLHAIAAGLLSELVAWGLLVIFKADFPDAPLLLVAADYATSMAALLVGTLAGSRLRPPSGGPLKSDPLRGPA